jgi:short-subunit dehydrogenase
MKILIAGNAKYGLAEQLDEVLRGEHILTYVSRSSPNSMDLTKPEGQQQFAEMAAVSHDVVILCSALWKFNQTLLLEATYKRLKAENKRTLIVCVGSTTDRVKKATDWLYNAEKKALRDYANSLAITGVWAAGPRVTLISFGTLSNMQAKHPDRKTMPIRKAAEYIKWILEQPADLHVNEISIDPLQS